jgi:hypothetical protein
VPLAQQLLPMPVEEVADQKHERVVQKGEHAMG